MGETENIVADKADNDVDILVAEALKHALAGVDPNSKCAEKLRQRLLELARHDGAEGLH